MNPHQINGVLSAINQVLEIDTRNLNTLSIQVVGAMVGTLQFEGTIDGTNWFPLNVVPRNSGTAATSGTAAGVWFGNCSAIMAARVRCSAYTSGTPTIALMATEESFNQPAGTTGSGGGGGAATVADGADINSGTTTDAAVTGDNAGTMSAKLRGIIKILGDLWDATNHKLITALSTDFLYNGATALTPKFAVITASSSGATQLVAAVASKKIRVLSYVLVCNAAVNAKFQSHVTPTDKTGLLYNGANGGEVVPFSPVGHFETIAGEALDINLSGAVAVGGHLTYIEV